MRFSSNNDLQCFTWTYVSAPDSAAMQNGVALRSGFAGYAAKDVRVAYLSQLTGFCVPWLSPCLRHNMLKIHVVVPPSPQWAVSCLAGQITAWKGGRVRNPDLAKVVRLAVKHHVKLDTINDLLGNVGLCWDTAASDLSMVIADTRPAPCSN